MNHGDLPCPDQKARLHCRLPCARPVLSLLLSVNLAAWSTHAGAAFKPAAPVAPPSSLAPAAPAKPAAPKPTVKAVAHPVVVAPAKTAAIEAAPVKRADARCVDLTTKLSLGVSELTNAEQAYFNDRCRLKP